MSRCRSAKVYIIIVAAVGSRSPRSVVIDKYRAHARAHQERKNPNKKDRVGGRGIFAVVVHTHTKSAVFNVLGKEAKFHLLYDDGTVSDDE